MAGGDAVCTVSCTTCITVPMSTELTPRIQASWVALHLSASQATNSRVAEAMIKAKEGKIAVRPERLISPLVAIEPKPTPTVMGSISSPVSAGEVPCITRKYIGTKVNSETSTAPWQAASTLLRRIAPLRNRSIGSSGTSVRRSS